ncbi:hypothetical protein [Parabacteroides sp. FAFU027]|uniref:hypothetical protein n=1 Tax=Parabacteroides sp. FAFU027 TaxID=2922715 RepID=UPI001FAF1CDB|nr:hypothetical protein [Parabacteroides sp. FAFU027]
MTETKLSISDSMKSGFQLWKKHLQKIMVVGLIVYFPTQICIELISVLFEKVFSIEENLNNLSLINNTYDMIRYLIGSVALLGILNFITNRLEKEDDEEQSIKDIILHGLRKWPTFIGVGFIAGIKILSYALLLIVPGIYKSVRLSFIDCEVATNDDKTIDSCDASEKLVDNHWWRVFGFSSLMFLLQVLLELLFVIPLFLNSESNIMSLLLGVTTKLLETYFIVVRANYYFRLKRQKDHDNITTEIKDDFNETQQGTAMTTI